MDTGELTVKGITTCNGLVGGASQEGYTYLADYITTSTFTQTIALNKVDYTWGILTISPSHVGSGSTSTTVIFTQATDEASATNAAGIYARAYSKIQGNSQLCDTLFSPAQSELTNVYIDNGVPCITFEFTKTGGGTGTFGGRVWWRVFQA